MISAPTPITNSTTSDRGRMNSTGLKATRMTKVFPPYVNYPVDAFVSNRAFEGQGFVQMFVELHPLGKFCDTESMKKELHIYSLTTANLAFENENSRLIPIQDISNPIDIGSTATKIEHLPHIRPVNRDGNSNLSEALICDITVALLR